MHFTTGLLLLVLTQLQPSSASPASHSDTGNGSASTFTATTFTDDNSTSKKDGHGRVSYKLTGRPFVTHTVATTPTAPSSQARLASAHHEEPEYNALYGIPCEAGHPCSKDEWCNPTQRCRPCADLQPWCHLTLTIHHNYTACEGYCYRYEAEKTERCEREKMEGREKIDELEASLEEAGYTLNETIQQAAIEQAACSREREEMSQKYQHQYSTNRKLQDDISHIKTLLDGYRIEIEKLKERPERCLADGQRGDSTIRGLTAGLVLVALLGAGAVGLTVWMCRRQHPLLCRDSRVRGHVTADSEQLVPREAEPKQPVQVKRHSTHFAGPQHDDYCLPGRGGYAHVPGDAQLAM